MKNALSTRFPCFRISSLISAVLTTLLLTSSAARADIPVDIPWSISRPQRLELVGNGPPLLLNYDTRSSRYGGLYPRNPRVPSFDNLNLVGWWNNQENRLLFLRISPLTTRLNLRVWRPVYQECRSEFIRPLNQITNDRDVALESYYRAKALYELNNENRCMGARREAAALAWFNRSYELTRLDCAFRLSPDASRAYGEFDPAYVRHYRDEAQGREVQCVNLAKNQAWQQGDLATAYSIGSALIETLSADAELRQLVVEEQKLTLDVLEAEREFIARRLVMALEQPSRPMRWFGNRYGVLPVEARPPSEIIAARLAWEDRPN